MTISVPILSNSDTLFSPREIQRDLPAYLPDSQQIKIELREEPETDMAIDPVIAAALINGSAVVMVALINGLFNYWRDKNKDEGEQKKLAIHIKIGKEDNELIFPYGMSEAEQRRLLERASDLAKIRHIALIEKEAE